MNNRIIVIGPSGSGKSTFSRKIAKIYNLPLYPLDNIFWNENKDHLSIEEFDAELNKIINTDKWIIDGDYNRTYEIRIKNADTIFFLDYSLETCLKGAEDRVGTKREDCPFIETEFDSEFKEWIINWFKDVKPLVTELIEKYKNEKNIIIFKNRDEAALYLEKLLNK